MSAIVDRKMKPIPVFDLAGAVVETAPFSHAILHECMSVEASERLLTWFETDAPWKLAETDFYQQWEFDMLAVSNPSSSMLTSDAAIADLRDAMGRLFGKELSTDVTMVAHRLLAGQRIGIHNDFLPDGETHRLTVQMNRGLADDDGGFLMTFSSDDAQDVHAVVRPIHRSAFAFAISPSSFHAVSRMHGNARYTIVISFNAVAD